MCAILMWSVFQAILACTSTGASVLHYYNSDARVNHLTVDRNTGDVYVGSVNKIYHFNNYLSVLNWAATGPVKENSDSGETGILKELNVDIVNKVLLIDYASNRLITCGTSAEGSCSVRNLENVSSDVREVSEAVVSNNATASTVAFIGPGPPNPLSTQVMYVAVTFTRNYSMRHEVPSLSSRSLEDGRLFKIAQQISTEIFVNTQSPDNYPINYVYGFHSEGFSYFLTTQLANLKSDKYYNKLVNVYQDAQNYNSYTEMLVSCTGQEQDSFDHHVLQAAFVGKAGSLLAGELGIAFDDDVLFTVFSRSESIDTDAQSQLSALCVYSLKYIRKQITESICFNDEKSCGIHVNVPVEGLKQLRSVPVAIFDERLTALAAAAAGDYTVVFAGTSQGHLKKIVLENSTSTFEYDDFTIDEGSSVNKDMIFDVQQKYLYMMTEFKVSKVRIYDCSLYRTCLTCKNPYCGWCTSENKCSPRAECDDAAKHPSSWIPYGRNSCTMVTEVKPNRLDIKMKQMLELSTSNLHIVEGQIFCEFTFKYYTSDVIILHTKANKQRNKIKCMSPPTHSLPLIPTGLNHLVAHLTLRTVQVMDIAGTNLTYFDCRRHITCRQCTSSQFPCDWDFFGNKCSLEINDNVFLRNNIIVPGVSTKRIAYSPRANSSYGAGPSFCPEIRSGLDGSNEILVHENPEMFQVKVGIIGKEIWERCNFTCQYIQNLRLIVVKANLVRDTVQCKTTGITHRYKRTTTALNVFCNDFPLGNPENVYIRFYNCHSKAYTCSKCLKLPKEYDCVWDTRFNICVRNNESQKSFTALHSFFSSLYKSMYVNRNEVCPNPKIYSFMPQSSSWDSSTNITIEGDNIGRTVSDIKSITVAGILCHPIPELYIESSRVVCSVEGPGESTLREGPIVIQILSGTEFRTSSSKNYSFVNPSLYKFLPHVGPKSGGTLVTIEGQFLNTGNKVNVFIGNKQKIPCDVQTWSSSEVTCKTRPSMKSQFGYLEMTFDNAVRVHQEYKFQYVEDPIVQTIERNQGIVSGGLNVKVTGKYFHAIQNPRMYVEYKGIEYYGPCRHVDYQTTLICKSPAIDSEIPELEILKPLQLEYGFIMDHVQSVQRLSNTSKEFFTLYPDPMFNKIGKLKIFDSDVIYLTINGANITRNFDPEDIEVLVGNNKCIVMFIHNQEIRCYSSLNVFIMKDTINVDLKVGNLNFNLGKLPLEKSETASCMCWSDTSQHVFGSLKLLGVGSFNTKESLLGRWSTRASVDNFVIEPIKTN